MTTKRSDQQTVECYLGKIKSYEHSKDLFRALSLCEEANTTFPNNNEIISKLARLRGKVSEKLPKGYLLMIPSAKASKKSWYVHPDGHLTRSLNGYDIKYNPESGEIEIDSVNYHSGVLSLNISDFKSL
jgi:hypothetical protein